MAIRKQKQGKLSNSFNINPLALLSVSDKSDLIPFASKLNSFGYKLVASGGTKKVLENSSIPVL
jgi:phosphoribosylaminoimidazolecarboxamide formyltransferase/IMP cyclohydrolase